MSITTQNTTTNTTSSSSSKTSASSSQTEAVEGSKALVASDFNTFLKLLTTQMENQDPLNPVDSTEFVAQIAQFSSVEQQINTNNTLTKILEALTLESTGSLAQWLGQEVRAVAPVKYQGQEVDVYPHKATIDANTATLMVSNADGEVVAEQRFEPDAPVVIWDGKLKDGSKAPEAVYTFSVRYATIKGETETADASTYGRVIEARREGADTLLLLEGGGVIDSADVTGARPPRTSVSSSSSSSES